VKRILKRVGLTLLTLLVLSAIFGGGYLLGPSQDQLAGDQIVLINFWAIWCVYCRSEMPALETVYRKYKDEDFLVLGVDEEETWSEVEACLQEVSFTFPVTLDSDGAIFGTYWGEGDTKLFYY
jgi:thiol-disulfide isomerase/thioredoxin